MFQNPKYVIRYDQYRIFGQLVTRRSIEPQSTDRANRILDAAAALVLHYGLDKTTVDDIAREAGISKGAIYLHFKSKDDLMEALILRETWAYMDAFMIDMNSDPMGGTLVNMFKHALTGLARRPLMRALYNRDMRVFGDYIRRRTPDYQARRFLLNREYIAAMQQAGLVRTDIDAEQMSYLFSVIGQGYLTLTPEILGAPLQPFDTSLALVVDMLSLYLTPPGLTDSDAGKRILNVMIEQVRAMMRNPDKEKKP